MGFGDALGTAASGAASAAARGVSNPAPNYSLAPSGGGYMGASPSTPVTYGGGPYSTAGVSAPSQSPTDISSTPYAWMLAIPDVSQILRQWQAGGHTDDWLKAQIINTNWYRTTSRSARDWEQLTSQDPATALEQRGGKAAQITALGGQLGMVLAPGTADSLADSALRYGWNDDQLKGYLLSSFTYEGAASKGAAAQYRVKYQDLSAQYGVPISDQTMGDWVKASLSGEQNESSFTGYLEQQAKSLYPALKSAIDQGVTVRQYFDPYVQVAAKELEIDPQSVNLLDPKWNAAINQIQQGTGDRVAMSLSDWQTKIRTDPTYGYDHTQNAKAAAAQLTTQLLQKFGEAA